MYSHMTSRVNKNVCMYVCKSERSLGKSLWKRKHTSDHTLGKSLLTSLFKFLLISVRVNPWKTSLCTQSSFKSWKSLLIWAVWVSFSSLQSIRMELATIKNCDIAGWQKRWWAHTVFVKTRFSKRISPKLFGISASKFQRLLNLLCSFNI